MTLSMIGFQIYIVCGLFYVPYWCNKPKGGQKWYFVSFLKCWHLLVPILHQYGRGLHKTSYKNRTTFKN